jgi:hypothetical protein
MSLKQQIEEIAQFTNKDYSDIMKIREALLLMAENVGGGTQPKVYKALLTQSGTDAPVATVLENSLGDIVWTRSNTGIYVATLANAFTVNKTIVDVPQKNIAVDNVYSYTSNTINTVLLVSRILSTLSPQDGLITNLPILIEVYP